MLNSKLCLLREKLVKRHSIRRGEHCKIDLLLIENETIAELVEHKKPWARLAQETRTNGSGRDRQAVRLAARECGRNIGELRRKIGKLRRIARQRKTVRSRDLETARQRDRENTEASENSVCKTRNCERGGDGSLKGTEQ